MARRHSDASHQLGFGDVTWFDGATACSISLWLKLSSLTGARLLTKWGDDINERCILVAVNADGTLFFAAVGAGGVLQGVSTGAILTTDVWQHFVLTWQPGTRPNNFAVWLDGSLQSLSTVFDSDVTSLNTSVSAFEVGFESEEAAGGFLGDIAELGVWRNLVLDSADIAALAAGVAPVFIRPDSLFCWAPFLGTGTSFEQNRVGGTALSSGTTVAEHPRMYYPQGPIGMFAPAAAASTQPPRSMHQFRLRRAG